MNPRTRTGVACSPSPRWPAAPSWPGPPAARAAAGRPGADAPGAGVGASLLRRFGAPVPDELDPLPPFLGDELDERRSDGDLGVLVTADDALVIAHALRTLTRLARGTVRVRWQMRGFSAAGGVVTGPIATPRNLMGQLDGTGNPRPSDDGFDEQVFAAHPLR